MKVMRMMWGVRLAVTLLGCLGVSGSAEPRFLCSSDSLSLWWDYEGPLDHFSLSVESCTNGMDVLNATYSLITKFTVRRIGYKINIYYKNQLWMEDVLPPISCRDFKICDIVKGETLSESISLAIKPYYAVEGEYLIHIDVNIIDDLEQERTFTLKVPMHVRDGESERDPQSTGAVESRKDLWGVAASRDGFSFL